MSDFDSNPFADPEAANPFAVSTLSGNWGQMGRKQNISDCVIMGGIAG